MTKDLDPYRQSTFRVLARNASLGILALLVLALAAPGSAHAASKIWDGGCGADAAWSCAGNWNDNAAPGAGDTVAFNSASISNSTVDAGFAGTVASINVGAGYTGTINLARSLTVTIAFSQAAGTFTAGGQTLSMAGFTLSAGHFVASSGTTSVSRAMTITGSPVFSANGGTFDFNGSTTAKLSCGNVNFSLVTFTQTAGTKTVSSNCSLPLGDDPVVTGGGSVTSNGSMSGTGTLTTAGLLSLGRTGSLSGLSGLVASRLTVNGNYDFGSYTTFSVSGAFALNTGAGFTAPSGTASFGAGFTLSPGSTFAAHGGVVDFNGSASGTLSCNGAGFALVAFTHTNGTKTVSSNCALPLGEDPTLGTSPAASVVLSGSLSGTGTLTGQGTFSLNSTAGLVGFNALSSNGGLVLKSASVDFGAYSSFYVATNYTQTGGVVTVPDGAKIGEAFTLNAGADFNAPSGSAIFEGRFTVNKGATFDANGGTVEFSGPASRVISCNNAVFHLVEFTHSEGTKTVSSNCNLPLGNSPNASSGGSIFLSGTLVGTGTLTTSGTLSLGSTGALSGFTGLAADALGVEGAHDFGPYSQFAVGGDFTLKPGAQFVAPPGEALFGGSFISEPESSFTANGGTVVLDGTNQVVAGNTTFNNLSKRVSLPDTLTFHAGDTQTIEGVLALEGKDAGDLLTLVSSIPGTSWLIDSEGTSKVAFASVSDSDNIGTPITPTESVNEGGNSGWIFPGPASELVLEAATTTPEAGEADNLTITARDAQGNTATSYTGSHNLSFGPIADSPSGAHATVTSSAGTATNFGTATAIVFTEGIATVSGGKNGAMTLVKAGSTSITVSDGSIANGAGLAITVSPGTAAKLAWTSATASKGTLSSLCLFSCTGTGLTSSGTFKANVSVTDSSGNTVSALGSGHTVSVTADSGTLTGGALTIASTGPAASTTQFTFTPPSKGAASTLTAATAAGTVYTSATASIAR
jgi:hypothetical protein